MLRVSEFSGFGLGSGVRVKLFGAGVGLKNILQQW